MTESDEKKLAIGLRALAFAFALVGFSLATYYGGWQVATGIILVLLANNILLDTHEGG